MDKHTEGGREANKLSTSPYFVTDRLQELSDNPGKYCSISTCEDLTVGAKTKACGRGMGQRSPQFRSHKGLSLRHIWTPSRRRATSVAEHRFAQGRILSRAFIKSWQQSAWGN